MPNRPKVKTGLLSRQGNGRLWTTTLVPLNSLLAPSGPLLKPCRFDAQPTRRHKPADREGLKTEKGNYGGLLLD